MVFAIYLFIYLFIYSCLFTVMKENYDILWWRRCSLKSDLCNPVTYLFKVHVKIAKICMVKLNAPTEIGLK